MLERPHNGWLKGVFASRATGLEDLEIGTGRFAVRCPIADRAAPEQLCASAVEGSALDRAAAGIYGCRAVDLVAIREAVGEPS